MRPEILFPVFANITSLSGVGPKTRAHYERLAGGSRIIDLLYHRPIGIIDRRKMPPLFQMQHGDVITAIVKVDMHIPPKTKNSHTPYRVICSNATGGITLVFFNAFPDYIKNNLPIGQMRVISGRAETFGGSLQMPHPDYIVAESRINEVLRVEPVYPLTSGIGQRAISKTIGNALKTMPNLPEWIDKVQLQAQNWLSWKDSLIKLHNPLEETDISTHGNILERLAYDEILAHQLALKLNRKLLHSKKGRSIKGNGSLREKLLAALPFELTKGQQEVIQEINTDQASENRMARLLQGDVGSGKTVVALMVALNTVEAGCQVAIMAPTEILANQHFKWIKGALASLPPCGGVDETKDKVRRSSRGGKATIMLQNARELRKNLTNAERKLWHKLNNNQLNNLKFRHQEIIGEYIVDFVCYQIRLIIELDGGQHAEERNMLQDKERTEFFESQGFKVLRFWNNNVLQNMDGVLENILNEINLMPPRFDLRPTASLSATPPQGGSDTSIALLTGSTKNAEREDILTKLAAGEIDIIIGTHALFQEKVNFHDLGLVVIDEQHRFGVKQRTQLAEKGKNSDILIMTATPIPRSLTMAIYGDMECSRLTEKPLGRKPIDTRVIPSAKIGAVVEGLKRVIEKGEKIYWICPLVEESENSELTAVEDRFTDFKRIFGDKVAMVHGRMKQPEREETMLKFRDGNVDILVATTVIEVGVDIPNATTIIIEHADRFGLSQLHQLRGRVGRNDKQSSCLLIYYGLGEIAKQRLSIMRESNDGFLLAEEDLKIRGGGDIMGEKQSGLPAFKIADLYEHRDLFYAAGKDAEQHIVSDPYFRSERGQALRVLFQLFEYDTQEKVLAT